MENVKGLRNSATYERATAVFRRAGYGLTEVIVNASFFGTPQARERLILAGCLGAADGWFHPYLNQYKSPQKLSIADVFGADFGTPLEEFALDPQDEEAIDQYASAEYAGYKLRQRDLRRLAANGVTSETRFFHATSGGEGSSRLQPIDKPAGTLIRTTMHALAKTYKPQPGDPVDLRKLYQPGFEEFSRIGGFPEDWKWPQIVSKQDSTVTKKEFVARARQRFLMLANAVPPPLAYNIGRAIVDHHDGRVPAAPVEENAVKDSTWKFKKGMRGFRRYVNWLRIGKRMNDRQVRQHLSDLRNVMNLVAGHKLSTASEKLSVFDRLAATGKEHMKAQRKSQLRKALLVRAEFEKYQTWTTGTGIYEDDEAYAIGGLDRVVALERLREEEECQKQERLEFAERMKNPPKLLRLATKRQRENPASDGPAPE